MTYAILGTGGIGGYYGARLAEGGKDVHFLFRSDYEYVKENGLRVDSCKGDIFLPKVNAWKIGATAGMPKADVVLVCIKTTGNDCLPQILPEIINDDTLVILIQNGLGMEEDLAAALPGINIAGATAFICATRIAPGHISHTDYGELNMAVYEDGPAAAPASPGLYEKLHKVADDLQSCNVPCNIAPSLTTLRWKKLVWNIPYNGLSVVENAMTDKLTFDPALRRRVLSLMKEVVAAGKACGADVDEAFADKMIDMTETMPPYYPSMYWDWKNGRQMEIRTMYRNPVTIALGHGVEMPDTKALMEELNDKMSH